MAGQWAQQKTWVEKDQKKSERASQPQKASTKDAPATDDDPTDGECAQKRRDKMQHQDKAEGDRDLTGRCVRHIAPALQIAAHIPPASTAKTATITSRCMKDVFQFGI